MKEFASQTGGRYTYIDDMMNLQDLALSLQVFSVAVTILSLVDVKSQATPLVPDMFISMERFVIVRELPVYPNGQRMCTKAIIRKRFRMRIHPTK